MLRRDIGNGCHNYFIANLGPEDIEDVTLACNAGAVEIFDPMNGESGFAQILPSPTGTRVRLDIPSGASLLLKTFKSRPGNASIRDWKYFEKNEETVLTGPWKLDFRRSEPAMPQTHFDLDTLQGWHTLPGGDVTEAVGVYSTSFIVPENAGGDWRLSLGQVRESAVVRINGIEAGTLIAAPFCLQIGKFLHTGENTLEVEVRNLPANHIAQMDRDGVVWRIFKDVNIAAVNSRQVVSYERIDNYGWWPVVPSGLIGPVRILR